MLGREPLRSSWFQKPQCDWFFAVRFSGDYDGMVQQPDGSYFAKCLEAGQLRYSLFPVYLLTFLHRTFCFFQGCHVVSSCVNKAFQGMFSALKFRLPRKKEGEFWRSSLLSTGVHPIDPFSCMFCAGKGTGCTFGMKFDLWSARCSFHLGATWHVYKWRANERLWNRAWIL